MRRNFSFASFIVLGFASPASPTRKARSGDGGGTDDDPPRHAAGEYAAHMRERRVGSVLVTGSTGRLFGVLYRDDAEAKLEERRRARDQSTSA